MKTYNAAKAAPRKTRSACRAVASSNSPADRREREIARRHLAAERVAFVLNSDGMLRLPEVLAVIPVSPSTWLQGIRDGRYPQGIKLGARCTAWPAASIRSLLASLTSEGAK